MFQLNNLKPNPGTRRRRKRVGRGPGSGHGTTAGRGTKGQHSRSGGASHPWFEGGQMPLYRRVPKRGFHSRNRVENQVVNLADFERMDSSREVDVAYLRELGIVSGPNPRVKLLGHGDVSGAFRVRVHAVSEAARRKIEGQGGSVEILPWDTKRDPRPEGASGRSGRGRAKKTASRGGESGSE